MKPSPNLARLSVAILSLAWTTTLGFGVDVVGQIPWNPALPDITYISPDTRVVIGSRPKDQAFIRKDGSFLLQDVGPGKYVLRVTCREFSFLPLTIEVPDPSDEKKLPIVRPYVIGQASAPSGHAQPSLSYPIQLIPRTRLEYIQPKVGFNPISMLLANPMYLLMGGMALFMMVMPKLMNMMDPEALAEVQANQANMRKQMASMQDLDLTSGISKLLASGSTEDSSDNPSSTTTKPSTSNTKIGSTSANARKRK